MTETRFWDRIPGLRSIKAQCRQQRLVWQEVPLAAALCLAYELVQGLLPVGTAFFTERLLSGLGGGFWTQMGLALLGLGILYVLSGLLAAIYQLALNVGLFEGLQYGLRRSFAKRKAWLPLIRLEDPAFLERLRGAEQVIEGEELPLFYLNLLKRLRALVSVFSLGLLLFSYHPLLLVPLLLAGLPTYVQRRLSVRALRRMRQRQIPLERELQYRGRWLEEGPEFRALRFWGREEEMAQRWTEIAAELRRQKLEFCARDQAQLTLCALIQEMGLLLALAYVLYLASISVLSFSVLAAALLSFKQLQEALAEYLSQRGGTQYYGARVDLLWDVWAACEQEGAGGLSGEKHATAAPEPVQIQNCSFAYPQQKAACLHALDFNWGLTERIALVGRNGAGKTSLAACLAGAYPWSGEQPGPLPRKELGRLALMPQRLPLLPLSIREFLDCGEGHADAELKTALERVNLPHLADCLDQNLRKDLGGLALSGGQLQRLYIARMLLAEADTYIFDEPSSALDAFQEEQFLSLLFGLSQGRRALIITHRLALCPRCDRILVLDQGRIVQAGRHQDLVAQEGLYRQLYQSQAEAYQS